MFCLPVFMVRGTFKKLRIVAANPVNGLLFGCKNWLAAQQWDSKV